IAEIKAPNNAIEYRRMNPIASFEKPVIIIKNNGTEPLTSAMITYGMDDFTTSSLKWTGNLAPFASTEITLPGIDLGQGAHTFTVTVSQPNGKTDEYSDNNALKVAYTTAKTYIGAITLDLKVDSKPGNPNGIRYEVKDMDGKILYSKQNMPDGAQIVETFKLADGHYTFTIYDDAFGSGLMFPFIQGYAAGNFILKDASGEVIYSAQPNYLPTSSWFGDRQKVSFSVQNGGTSINEDALQEQSFRIFPNPSSGESTIHSPSAIRSIEICSPRGAVLKTLTGFSGSKASIDLSKFSAGYYILRLTTQTGISTFPFVKQ
ncbi:MAG TPA: T9SS type A sorting domain-containing protein, partial [Patescibacteria group bacterium]|nr:T9SS type A sorting domain-containing protein [Patescibacteria group bacterium]